MLYLFLKNNVCKPNHYYDVNKIVLTFEFIQRFNFKVMTKTSTFILSSLLVLLLCSNSCNNGEKGNSNENSKKETMKLNSKEALFEKYSQLYPGISGNDVCIEEMKSFKDFFVVGLFAHDRGCGDNAYYYKGDSIALTDENIQKILIDNGFKNKPSETIEKYHLEVVNINKNNLTTVPDKFDTLSYEFFPPKTYIEDDMIYSSIWVQRPSGMIPEVRFYLSNLVFDTKGKLVSSSQTKAFSVDY